MKPTEEILVDQIPVIDIRRLDEDDAVLAELDHACRHWGFFQAVNHGVASDLVAALLAEMRAFFALPLETKRAIERTADNAWGFYDAELTKNRRDWKQIFDVGPDGGAGPLAGNRAQWPAEPPAFRAVLQAYSAASEALSSRLLAAITRALGMPATHLRGAFEPAHSSFLRLNYYPSCDDPAAPGSPIGAAGNFGIHHHTDAGALTVLAQDDQAGLEVLHDGSWTLVQPRRDALVINIGDIVQVWSNDRYPAPLHRVIANRSERHSAAFFFNPSYETTYAPLPGVIDADHPPRYRPIHWGDFRAGRAAGDYADHGEEIQISHYRS